MTEIERCATCGKPKVICVCDRTVKLANRHEVLVLRHPQEQDELLGTARLAELSLAKCELVTGLSWPSLAAALGRDAKPSAWAVLYRGSLARPLTRAEEERPFLLLDRAGESRRDAGAIEGIVVLDGTWSQAKTLWWRNAWLLRMNRIVLHPREPSAYGRLRAESQREHLSTIEAIAEALNGLGEDPAIGTQLRRVFRTMVQRARDAQSRGEPGAPIAPKPGRARRRPKVSRGGGPLD